MPVVKTPGAWAIALSAAFGLSKGEAAVIERMLDGERATRDRLLGALTSLDGRLFRHPAVAKVMLCRARRKLAAHGVSVERGRGRTAPWIDDQNIQKIRGIALRSLSEAA